MIYLILMTVVSSVLTERLCVRHTLQDKNDPKKIKDYQVLIVSLLFGSLGYFMAFFLFNYRSDKEWFFYLHLVFLMIQMTVLFILAIS